MVHKALKYSVQSFGEYVRNASIISISYVPTGSEYLLVVVGDVTQHGKVSEEFRDY